MAKYRSRILGPRQVHSRLHEIRNPRNGRYRALRPPNCARSSHQTGCPQLQCPSCLKLQVKCFQMHPNKWHANDLRVFVVLWQSKKHVLRQYRIPKLIPKCPIPSAPSLKGSSNVPPLVRWNACLPMTRKGR